MNSVLENEAVQRVQKALSIFDNNIKISILEKGKIITHGNLAEIFLGFKISSRKSN